MIRAVAFTQKVLRAKIEKSPNEQKSRDRYRLVELQPRQDVGRHDRVEERQTKERCRLWRERDLESGFVFFHSKGYLTVSRTPPQSRPCS